MNLAEAHCEGRGVTQDDARCAALARQACRDGSAHACHNLGVLTFAGKGTPRDVIEAVRLFELACHGGG